MPLEPGNKLGPYELVAQIGAGGMGVVWKAFDSSLNRHVAIKFLPSRLTDDVEWKIRFRREAQAAAGLDHPNIAVIHQVGEHDGAPFIVMQLLDGKTLRQTLREGPMPLKEWLRVAAALADGLSHAHGKGIIHRDLKPDNVMITGDGQVKILDFGLAKSVNPDAAGSTPGPGSDTTSDELTHVGKVLGTRSYMSPEQARGEPMDHRSDLFSLGILLYEMAAGRVPFRGQSDVEILGAIISSEAEPLAGLAEQMPAEAERVVRKAMEKEPERRYQHGDEIATDLRNLQRDLTSGRIQRVSGPVSQMTSVEVSPLPASAATPEPAAGRPVWLLPVVGLAVVAVAIVAYLQLRPAESSAVADASAADPGRKLIVVLPFENLGPAEDEYFAAGITEEINSRLASVGGLGVISSKSAIRYAGTTKSTKEVGEELGVGYVLQGKVRWSRQDGTSRVRITPELIGVSDDTAIWAEAYDEVIDDIFAVQSEIAAKVIDHVGGALGGRVPSRDRPTDSLEAYHAYIRGMHHLQRPDYTEESYALQVELFSRAVRLDPVFALAWAKLSRSQSGMYHFGFDRTPQRQTLARQAAEKSLELEPDLPEAHLALGLYHYWCHKDYDRAMESFAVVEQGLPSNTDVMELVGFVKRRQGLWQEAAAKLERAYELNPASSELCIEIGATHAYLRDYPKSAGFYETAISMVPDQSMAYAEKAMLHWLWTGDMPAARAALEAIPDEGDPYLDWFWFRQLIMEGSYQEAIERLEASPNVVVQHYRVVRPKSLMLAQVLELTGRPDAAGEAYRVAREILEHEIEARPDDYRLHTSFGMVLAGLGLEQEAIRHAERALELYPMSKDAVYGTQTVEDAAMVYTLAGEHDAALDQLDALLSAPSLFSVRLLENDPRWKPLRELPRFRELVARHG